jgi:2-keto-4-pentenoate hydratase/2-oxohepta-3-ene-1,7-dioic acid hydratase in catechol pathway
MKIARVTFGDDVLPALAHDDHWVAAAALGPVKDADVLDLLLRQDELRAALDGVDVTSLVADGQAVPLAGAELHQPLVGPRAIVAVGLNYRAHAQEVSVTWQAPTTPLLFAKWPSSMTGPTDPIPVDPELSEKVDYEVELAVVIGRTALDVSEADALSYVAAYAVANDISARDIQSSESQWTRAKSFDGFCPIGPWLTTADEVPDPQALDISCTVDGARLQDSSTAHMIHPVAKLIAYITRGMTLQPGDLVLTGTPAGVAMASDDPQWLTPGRVVRSEIQGLGHLENPVVDRAELRR